ncbi:MAG: metal-dependent hydrolase [Candidatus Marinimicrobia bacterium]|nr:metal-dependent hydrolase [Candidatus Neomarinimicrobiota bacterium]MBL7109332.1 metal-dependent hydrolase [Candidatus Neomarinimicrobiota bacterium]
MSSGKGHIVGGFVFLWLFLTVLSNFFFVPSAMEIVIYTAIAIMFALWPDVDIKSIGQKLFYTIFFITDVVLVFYFQDYKSAAFFGLLIILPILAKHRGWTHSKITAVLLPTPLLLVPMGYVWGNVSRRVTLLFCRCNRVF